MNSGTEPSPAQSDILKKEWNQAARSFYSVSALAKQDPSRYKIFLKAYGRVASLLDISAKSSVLDVGCGCGELAKAIAHLSGSFCGVDISPESIALARERNPQAVFIESDASASLPNGPFDAVSALTCLEFCYDKGKVLREIHRIMTPNGRFYMEVRNGSFPLARIPGSLRTALEKAGVLVPYPAPGFRDLDYNDWVELLDDTGFDVTMVTNACRPLFYGDWKTRTRNSIIMLIDFILPTKLHYMVGFLCCKKAKAK